MPKWFSTIAIILVLWNLMGVFSFLSHTFISQEALAALPQNERALYTQYPLWTTIIFGIAVGTGICGAIGFLLRKNWSFMAFLISLITLIPQMIHNVFFTESIEVYGLGMTLTMPILVVIFGILSVWISNRAINNKWYIK